ncbi:hypothetical protein JXQ31_06725 [candidate division KSB1 bacterium]|nr:hypothetical protein [candidate division KSB1 bacterium]
MKKNICLGLLTIMLILSGSLYARYDEMVLDETFVITDGKLVINAHIDVGQVTIKRNNNPGECHVYIKYLTERVDADIRFNEKHNELDVIVDFENWKSWKDNTGDSTTPKVIIELPSEPVLDIEADLKAGEFNLELGGLYLENLDFDNWAGEATINFDLPNKMEMNRLDINFKVGDLKVLNLGNARFSEADINSGIGELTLDFSGKSPEKAMAKIDLDIGETRVIIPENIGTKLRVSKFLFLSQVRYPNWFEKRGRYYYSDNYNESNKSLYLMISTGIGELSIEVK